ncbi:hypothetical protein D5086_015373 [Populus alba]|uniref:Uncharacterized protein n=1 Tax=Populus alba TaxID=43335 RepID=A0ACC4C0Q8_POPAL
MGVEKQVIRPGTGPKPTAGQNVTVHCTGFGKNRDLSQKFWSTKDPGQKPFAFKIGQGSVIKGWDEGVMGMQVGEVARLRCSPDYAYGAGGFPAWGIQPNSVLDFEIEVLSLDYFEVSQTDTADIGHKKSPLNKQAHQVEEHSQRYLEPSKIPLDHNMGLKGFAEGGIASIIAGASTHPLDLIKVRMQLQGESHIPNPSALQSYRPAFALSSAANISLPTTLEVPPLPRVGPLSIGLRIIQSEGANALFSGVSATILRQTLYSTTRMGLYDVLKHKWTDSETNNMPLARKIVAGLISGAVGAAVGNPADVAMVRMQADGRLPIEQRRNYKSVVDALGQMSKHEGVASLWRGSGLTINRAMIVTASQLATYDQAKEMILEKGLMNDGIGTHVTASFVAGFVASVASNPIDVIKTRVMNMKVEPGVEPPYKGALDCAMKTVRVEGPMALYKGPLTSSSPPGLMAKSLLDLSSHSSPYDRDIRLFKG